MKKSRLIIWALLLIFSISVVGCSTNNEAVKDADKDKIQVYTSFYVLADFAQKIGGEYIEVTNMIPAGTEPHDYEPTPKQIAQLQKADLFIYNGTGFDTWALNLIQNNKNKMAVVNSTEGIQLLTMKEEGTGHQDGDVHEGGMDPHVWLNPMNAILQAEKIKEGLIQVDPTHKDEYSKNFEQLKQSFNELDQNFQKSLKSVDKREIFVSHAAFGYLADRYQLKQIAISGITPSDEPSPKELTTIVDQAKEHQIKYILFEPLVESKYATMIMNEIGAKSLTLHPLESLTKEEIEKGEDYFSVMNKNLEVLKIALGVK